MAELQDVPTEALDASSRESPISHRLVCTRRGWAWRTSRFALFFGAGLIATGLALYSVFSCVGAGASFRYSALGIISGTGMLCSVMYALGRLYGLTVLFDQADNCVMVSQGRKVVEQYPLRELAAIQVCYRYDGPQGRAEEPRTAETGIVGKKMETFLVGRYQEGKPLQDDDFQLVLVRRQRNGKIERQWILSTMSVSQVRKLGKKTARAVGVPFLDCATPEHVGRVRAEFLKAGGRLPRPQRGG